MGLNLNDYVGGEYLSIEDLQDGNDWVVIQIGVKKFEDDREKPQLGLERNGTTKTFTLNSTNTKHLIDVFGNDSDALVGKKITLVKQVDYFKGKKFDVIRVDPEKTRQNNIQQVVS